MSNTFTLWKDDSGRNNDRIRSNAHEFIDRLPESKSWTIEIKQHVKRRSDSQNRSLFGVAYPPLESETGHTKDELHEAFCRRFFGSVDTEIMGQVVTRPFRTTTTDENGRRDVIPAGQFVEFYAMVQQIGAEAGVYVPDPDPMHGTRLEAA